MADLADMVKEHLDRQESAGRHLDWPEALVALRAMLAIERTDRRFVRADDPETTAWMRGHDEALDEVANAIAAALVPVRGGGSATSSVGWGGVPTHRCGKPARTNLGVVHCLQRPGHEGAC